MRVLLDTHAFLWWRTDQLSARATAAIADPTNEVFLSAASAWEIAVKRVTGRLRFDGDVASMAEQDGIRSLDITIAHATLAGELPMHHRDPFDRLLVAQAIVEQLVLITRDKAMDAYDVPLLLA